MFMHSLAHAMQSRPKVWHLQQASPFHYIRSWEAAINTVICLAL